MNDKSYEDIVKKLVDEKNILKALIVIPPCEHESCDSKKICKIFQQKYLPDLMKVILNQSENYMKKLKSIFKVFFIEIM